MPEKPPLAKPPSLHPQIAAIIVPPVAQEYPDRLLLTGQHAFGISIPAPEVYEATHVAQHLPEIVGTFPGNRESSDRAGTRSVDFMLLRIFWNVVLLIQHRHQLLGDHARVLVFGRVMLGAAGLLCSLTQGETL